MLDDTREKEKIINPVEYDELGNRFVYNPATGFHEYAPLDAGEEKPITDFAY